MERLIEESDYEFRQRFIKNIPKGSVVWSGSTKEHFGTTEGKGVYTDLSQYVNVKNVDDDKGYRGTWLIYSVTLKKTN